VIPSGSHASANGAVAGIISERVVSRLAEQYVGVAETWDYSDVWFLEAVAWADRPEGAELTESSKPAMPSTTPSSTWMRSSVP
jgi:hypothetical protein